MFRAVFFTMGRWLLVWIALVGLMLMGADGGPESIWPWNILIGAVLFFPPVGFGIWWDNSRSKS